MPQQTIREFLLNYDAGKYDAPDTETQIAAGWYDWDCPDHLLAAKTRKLATKLDELCLSHSKIDVDKMYAFFQNQKIQSSGETFDSIGISEMDKTPVYRIYPLHPASRQAEVWGNGLRGPLFVGTWRDVVNWFRGL